MFTKTLAIFFVALAFWGGVELVSTLFSLPKMETGSLEWWVVCGVIGIISVELVEYFIKRKNKKEVLTVKGNYVTMPSFFGALP